jgi:cell division protein FtsZ
MRGARGVLINITGGPDMTLFEVDEAANRIREEVDADANIIFGSTFDQNMEGSMRVSIVATGIDANAEALPRSPMISLVHDADQSKAKKIETEAATEDKAADVTAETKETEVVAEAPVVAETPKPEAKDEAVAAAPMTWPEETEVSTPSTAPAFIPPKPAAAERRGETPGQPRKADAFAEAAITNAGAQAERRRGRSLFQKVTGAVNRAMTEELPADKPPAAERREPVATAPAATPKPAAPVTAPVVKATPEPVAEPQPAVAAAPAAEPVKTQVETPAPVAAEKPAEPAVAEAPKAPEPVAAKPKAPAQQSLADIKPAEPRQSASAEEDMLEIPAFLRRQAN